MQIQSMTEASPTKWHLAHTSWAFETFILKPHFNNYQPFDNSFEYLFNSYYNAIGEQFPRTQRGLLSRPDITTVFAYRKHVDQFMLTFLEKPLEDLSINKLILLLLNHEQQHQELMLTDLKHALFQNPTYPIYNGDGLPNTSSSIKNPPNNLWQDFPSGLFEIGHSDEEFYFDNEGPRHQVYLEKFQIATQLISNREYLEFVENNGYKNSSYWLSEAWALINETKSIAPLYWVRKNKQWYQYTLSGLTKLDLDAPVQHISYFEANAYAASVEKRLPTEFEWEMAARSKSDLKQMFSTLWQWTSSSYGAYPGFKIAEGAIGEYNGKFMVNQYVLRGGSKVTPDKHIRASYRNFFYPNTSWQYTGIRLAESL